MTDQTSLRNSRFGGDFLAARNFNSRPHLTSKDIHERFLSSFVQTHKYDDLKSTKRNYRNFTSQFSHPHSQRVFNSPTYIDCMWYGQTRNPTTYTDLLHDSINDFELRLQEIITKVVTDEFNVTEDSSEISENDVQKSLNEFSKYFVLLSPET